MKQYLDLLRHVMENGIHKPSRAKLLSTGEHVGTTSVFGYQMRFDLSKGFPLVTTKKVALGAVIHELIWFISGDTNIRYLKENNVKIWNEWQDENGDLGPVYGAQFRRWKTPEGKEIDQLTNLIEGIKKNPHGRRHILSAWNVADIDKMRLPPCHMMTQFYVADGKLSCQLYQRSVDLFLGAPFNFASYALLTHMVAQVCSLEVGEFIHTSGDAHIYDNHKEQVLTQLAREPHPLPKLRLNPDIKDILQFRREDVSIENYQHHDKLVGEVAV